MPGPESGNIAIIVLAAGASRRMGQPKQLLRYRGESLIGRILGISLATACRPVMLVLGANAATIQEEIAERGALIIINKDWEKGMGSSLSCGMTTLEKLYPETEAVLFLLADQPLIDKGLLDKLVAAFEQSRNPIIATEYGTTLGVPALFGKELFDELLELKADKGARTMIEKHRKRVLAIPFPNAAIDIDTAEDWQKFLRKN